MGGTCRMRMGERCGCPKFPSHLNYQPHDEKVVPGRWEPEGSDRAVEENGGYWSTINGGNTDKRYRGGGNLSGEGRSTRFSGKPMLNAILPTQSN